MAGGAESSGSRVWRGTWPRTATTCSRFTLFQCGGAGARATKDGLQRHRLPERRGRRAGRGVRDAARRSSMHRSELRTDSGGAGRCRGGLGQWTESSYRGDGHWGVSAMIDRTRFAGQGAGRRPARRARRVRARRTASAPPAEDARAAGRRRARAPATRRAAAATATRCSATAGAACWPTSSTATSRSRRPSASTAS